jgi:hypothetical protein
MVPVAKARNRRERKKLTVFHCRPPHLACHLEFVANDVAREPSVYASSTNTFTK